MKQLQCLWKRTPAGELAFVIYGKEREMDFLIRPYLCLADSSDSYLSATDTVRKRFYCIRAKQTTIRQETCFFDVGHLDMDVSKIHFQTVLAIIN